MVLFKRKAVTFQDPPSRLDNNTEIWEIEETGELFTDYERYLARHDFLSQRKFTDAVNGKSGMTFFDAVKSENNSTNDIDKVFPDALRDPILRKVQFSETARIDELVTQVFEEFRDDFFPGEEVIVTLEEGEQLEGTIREKAKFPELRHPDGSLLRQAFSRYFVRLQDGSGDEALLDQTHVKRGRHVFTKQNLRSFLKHSLERQPHTAAWLVKQHLAVQYRLPMEIPPHIQVKALNEQRRSQSHQQPSSGHFNQVSGRKGTNLTMKDFTPEQLAMHNSGVPFSNEYNFNGVAAKQPEVAKAPPKYPIEDLELPAKHDGTHRPKLKFLAPLDGSPSPETGLLQSSVGALLELWNTLNVLCEVYLLDSFTFDDFFDALKFSSPEITCELFEEVHCAVLKQLVNEEGEIQVQLPDMPDDSDEDDEEDEEEEAESEPATPLDAPAHATRSRLSQVQNAADPEPMEEDQDQVPHRAAEMLAEYGWVDRLQKRDFSDGGWQIIIVGLLYQLSLDIRHKHACEKILIELAPLDEEPTQHTARHRYSVLDLNLRISALQIITMLSLPTKRMRSFFEETSEDMTRIRKKKVEHQRKRKEHLAQHAKLELERRTANPDAELPKEDDHTLLSNGDIDDTMDTNGGSVSDADEDASSRPMRRSNDRKRKRDEEAARKERERIEKAEAAKVSSDKIKKYKKILKDMDAVRDLVRDCEDEIADCDKDLREASTWRTRALGRDRFWNRYMWFERNGMPFEGIPDSSASEYGYMNARIWVQGPVDEERLGYIEVTPAEQEAYKREHQMTVSERKVQEEGPTSVHRATEWGYYDDPDSIDQLLGWLDERGKREKALRKEFVDYREDMVRTMGKLNAANNAEKAKKEEDGAEAPVARFSTRHKTYVDVTATTQRCLKWKNGYALREIGHIHSETRRPKEKKAKTEPKKEGKGVAVKVQPASKAAAAKAEAISTRQTRSRR